MARKYFGTDGVRGWVGQFPLTVDFVLKLGNAVGRLLEKQHKEKPCVVIGQDTRASCDMLKNAFISGITAAGVNVINLGIVPTPVVAFMVERLRAQAGVVISASHNPYYDNGIKLFSHEGHKLPDAFEMEIERHIDGEFYYVGNDRFGVVENQINQIEPYVSYCREKFAKNMDLTGKKVVLDCANGATFRVAKAVFENLGIEFTEIASDPDGYNINEDCGAVHTQKLVDTVVKMKADIGIAFDGDGDRLMLVDHSGRVIDGDEILYLLAQAPEIVGSIGGVVGTVMTNLAVEKALAEEEVAFKRAKVGDRYVMEMMLDNGWCLGGEASGHIINLNFNSTGDGLMAALQVLAVISQRKASLFDLCRIKKMPQVMINVPLLRKIDAQDLSLLIEDVTFVEKAMAADGRVVLRPSGTENLLRVMVEARDDRVAQKWAHYLVDKVKEKIQE
ncbi:MAG: phosphoglucosamine mutase [Francisellaceae bacterium]